MRQGWASWNLQWKVTANTARANLIYFPRHLDTVVLWICRGRGQDRTGKSTINHTYPRFLRLTDVDRGLRRSNKPFNRELKIALSTSENKNQPGCCSLMPDCPAHGPKVRRVAKVELVLLLALDKNLLPQPLLGT